MENSDSVSEDGPMEAKGTAASKAIRKNFTKLSKAVTRGDVLEELYAQEMIDQQTFEIYTNPSITDRDKGRKILLAVQNTVEIQPDLFDTFCCILDDESDVTKELSKRLRESYKKILEAYQKKEKTKRPSIETEEFKKLKNELEVYKKALAKAEAPKEALFTCIRESIRQYVEDMLETDESVNSLQKHMSDLCYEHFLIPSELTEWVSRVVETINSDRSPDQAVANPKPLQLREQTKPQEPPLFNKDTVYHASLCCHAVSTRNAGNFKHFFDHLVRGHRLEEVSMSVSKDKENVDRYLIAKQLNTIYVAFQSEATISQWVDEYSSFDDGLEKQRERIPIRFLEELLVSKRIVLTGFSFGGMLACCVAANIWKRSQISTDVLKDRVICITFGQPLISIPFVQEVMKDCQQFEATIYSMFSKDDVIPGLLRYFTIGCVHYRGGSSSSLKALAPANGTKAADKPLQPVITLPADGPKVDFKAPFAAVFLKNLASLQDSVHPEKALGDLKEALHQVIPYAEVDPDVVVGNCYLTVSEGHGITSKPVPKKVVAFELGVLSIPKLDTSLFRKHNMEEYRQSLLRGYLEKGSPKYSLPGSAVPVQEVGFLKPDVNTVEVHKYPHEVAVVLEGDNLWFCHQIRLGDYTPHIPKLAEHIARRSIQFNFCLSEQTAKIVADDGYVKVTLFSHFSNPIRRRVKAELEPEHSISLRQMQLAKHTPSEVIELAYLGAMLKCHSQHEVQLTTSKRFREVARFLEEAVQVVPLESIFFAIAYSDDNSNTALECAKALQKSKLHVPPSEMMVIGSEKAAFCMRTGIRPEVLDHCKARALSELSARLHPALKPYRSYPSPKPTYQTYQGSPKPTYSDITRSSGPVSASQVLLPPETFLIPVRFSINVKSLPPGSHGRAFPEVAAFLEELSQTVLERAVAKGNTLDVVCKPNIERIYPADAYRRHTMHGTLQSPLDVLKDARKQLAFLVDELQQNSNTVATVGTQPANEEMLEFVREIRENNLKICAALLGSFMEQQIHIPLLNSPMDTAKVLSSRSAPVAVGVWALFSMSHPDLQRMLSSTQSNSLTVEIADYIAGIFDPNLQHPETKRKKQSDSKYAGKLQFMLQGIKKTVSCSTQYISYSLERQLCSNPKVNKSIKSIQVKDLIENWDKIFEGDALSLVAKSHRPLIARWMKWAILVHDLREALASYMCVGVIGLINSGKSQLVNTLFKVQAQVGTIKSKRTTVPLMYNLDGKVDGLDVIDFPGVDDKDKSIPQLANLLLGLVQAVIFVVDRGKFSSGQVAIEQWLRELKAKDVPVLLCLTHTDRLYAECMEHDGTLEPTPHKHKTIEADLREKRNEIDNIAHHPSWAVHHYCFHLPEDSKLKYEHLKEVGIGFPKDVGEWIVKTFRQKLDQNVLADKLQNFLRK